MLLRIRVSHKLSAWCAAAVFGFAATVASGQSTSQGAIAGTVEDVTNAVVPGAAVTIHNDGTNAEQHLTADSSGYFKAPLLEPGTYTVTILASGFGDFKADAVIVQVGQLTSLEPKLKTGSTAQTVTVSADSTVLNTESPDFSSELTSNALANIPVQNRRWSSLALTTPGVVADSSGFGLISVRGQSTLLNNVEIDGADDNQAYFSEERGRTREGYSTTPGAVREFDVNTGVYSAQYGRATGAVINSVTRSGTNQIHGTVNFNDLDRGFGAYVPGSVSAAGEPLKPKDLRKIYGFSAGGPLIKNKLFWFYTYNQLTHIDPAVAQAKSYGNANGSTVGSFLEQPDTTVTSCNLTTGAVVATGGAHTTLDGQVCTLAARLKLASYAAAVTYYNNGVSGAGGLTSDLGIVPRFGDQEINSPKLDWQVNPKEHVTLLFNRLRWDAPGDIQTNSTGTYSVDAFGTDFVKLDYGVAKLVSLLTNRMSNELLYQYSRELDDEGQQKYSAYTLNNLVAAGGAGSNGLTNAPGGTVPYIGLDTSIGFNLGSPYYSYRLKYPDERKWQVGDILYYQLGNHSLRVGGDFVHNYDLQTQTPYYFGDYTYSTITNYLTDLATKSTATSAGVCNSSGGAGTSTTSGVGTYHCYSSSYQDFGATTYQIATTDYAGFVQDNWKVRPRLTLELGLRYDYESIPAPTSALTSAAGSFVPYAGLNNAPSDKNNFGPRVGFSVDVFGDGNTVLRGGAGLYYGRIVNNTIASAQFGSGSPNGQYQSASVKPTATGAPSFPYPLAGGSASKPSSFFLAPNLQDPMAQEEDLQVQQQMGKGTVLQISYLGSQGRELPNFLDVNLAPPQDLEYVTISGGPGNGQTAVPVPTFGTCTASATCAHPTGYLNTNFTNITEVISNINSSYNALVFEILNRSFHGLQFDANYTWSHALDFNQNATAGTSTNGWLNPYANARQNYGISEFNVGSRFVGYVLYNFPNIGSGGPLKYVANGWTFDDTFQMQNGLPYSAEINTGYNSAAALNSSWNGVPSVYYIPTIGINTFQVPRAIVDDIRLQKAFLFGDRYDLQLAADMYNVANHENFSTTDINDDAYNFGSTTVAVGAPTVGSAANPAVLTYIPKTAPNVGFGSHTAANNSGFLYTPREIEISAKLVF
jgi:hypothetical protein